MTDLFRLSAHLAPAVNPFVPPEGIPADPDRPDAAGLSALDTETLLVAAVGTDAEGKTVLCETAAAIDLLTGGLITAHLECDFSAAAEGALLWLEPRLCEGRHIAVLALGVLSRLTPVKTGELTAAAFRHFGRFEKVMLTLTDAVPGTADAAALTLGTAALNALTPRATLKTAPESRPQLLTGIVLCAAPGETCSDAFRSALAEAEIAAEGMGIMRGLADLPGNVCTPSFLAEVLEREVSRTPGLRLTVLDEPAIREAGMGAFLSVAQGSAVPPRFIALEYAGAGSEAPVALIGKGITFDAGGISLKPAANMADMTYDMSGAAAVIGATVALARAGVAQPLLCTVAACENLPSGSAAKPGDVVTSLSGKTVEILNTDCEGRMVLADALTWTARKSPAVMIDAATLTGACCVALGAPYTGLFTGDDMLAAALLEAGRETADPFWRLPVGPEYLALMKSEAADIANQATVRDGGASSAAAFLSEFTLGVRWAHLDIAATANTSGRARRSTGRPVPALVHAVLGRTLLD